MSQYTTEEIVKLEERVTSELSANIEIAVNKMYDVYNAYEERKVRELFNSAVAQFYASYTPIRYKRRYSLYDVLHIENGRVIYSNLFDWSKVKDRSGKDSHDPSENPKSYYSLFFEQGWHGGATKIKPSSVYQWGAHPNPGTPYWRKDIRVFVGGQTVVVRYGTWGDQAYQTYSDAPLTIIKREFPALDAEMWRTFCQLSQDTLNREIRKINMKYPDVIQFEEVVINV